MKTYTREQLIEAQQKYNDVYNTQREIFEPGGPDYIPRGWAERTIDFLLSFADDGEEEPGIAPEQLSRIEEIRKLPPGEKGAGEL